MVDCGRGVKVRQTHKLKTIFFLLLFEWESEANIIYMRDSNGIISVGEDNDYNAVIEIMSD